MFFAAAALAGAAPVAACRPGLKPVIIADLYFGRSSLAGEVSETAWQRFMDEELTPRFPDGLTVEDAAGQWRGRDGTIREKSKHVIIVITAPRATSAKLDAVRAAYKARFSQDSVLLTETTGCGSF
jgi:Protein of unknown function (DUF3574).